MGRDNRREKCLHRTIDIKRTPTKVTFRCAICGDVYERESVIPRAPEMLGEKGGPNGKDAA